MTVRGEVGVGTAGAGGATGGAAGGAAGGLDPKFVVDGLFGTVNLGTDSAVYGGEKCFN